MAANPTVEMRSVGRWPGRCKGRIAAIVRVPCTVLYCTGTWGINRTGAATALRGTPSDTTGPGHQQYLSPSPPQSSSPHVLRDSMSSLH